jgi:hypothetical protein
MLTNLVGIIHHGDVSMSSPPPSTRHAVEPWRAAGARALHPSTKPASATPGGVPLVADIALGLAAVSVPWELATGEAPDERRHELLLATEAYDAYLIYWPPGSGLEAHDHGGSAGAFAVVTGQLDEDTILQGGTVTKRVGRGSPAHFGAASIHAVVNRGDVGATSVHVYAPPLRAMSYYRRSDDGRLVVDRTDDVEAPRS